MTRRGVAMSNFQVIIRDYEAIACYQAALFIRAGQRCQGPVSDAGRVSPKPEPVTGLQFYFSNRSHFELLSVSADVDLVFLSGLVNERYKVFLFRRLRLVLFNRVNFARGKTSNLCLFGYKRNSRARRVAV